MNPDTTASNSIPRASAPRPEVDPAFVAALERAGGGHDSSARSGAGDVDMAVGSKRPFVAQ
jgi:hypothetical protein